MHFSVRLFSKGCVCAGTGGSVFKQINEHYASILEQYVKFFVEKNTKELYDAEICTQFYCSTGPYRFLTELDRALGDSLSIMHWLQRYTTTSFSLNYMSFMFCM